LNEADIYREWAPPESWRAAVACCWEQRVGLARTQRVLPDGHADLLFPDSGDVQVVGLHDQVDLVPLPAGMHVTGIRLRPAAVAEAFRFPASSLRNQTLAAQDVIGARAARAMRDPKRRDAWLRSIQPDARVELAILGLTARPVAEVAGSLQMSGRHLRRLLLEHTGLAPKALQRIVRFQKFVRAGDAGATLAGAAAYAGYADQPHLSREARALAGITPAQLIAERKQGTSARA
jgi:AraC-like DNA-binding protein